MNSILHSPWTTALGWTLLHSLWQGLVVAAIVYGLLRMIPGRRAATRYTLVTAGLGLVLIAAIITYAYLSPSYTVPSQARTTAFFTTSPVLTTDAAPASHWLVWTTTVDRAMPWIVSLWLVGASVFCLRLLGGWYYLVGLRRRAQVISDAWATRLQTLATQLGIQRPVVLAESSEIHAPAVVGWLKPVVLIPVGMFAGLSTEQVEAIFIHELAHIRRHDYLINLLQSLVEALLFYNPFVWLLSSWMRREREHCCDDAVVAQHHSARAYVLALTALEQQRIQTSLAPSLLGQRHELFNRIQRLMEKSVQQPQHRERMIPVVLLVIGLICASWLTINASQRQSPRSASTTAADTTARPKKGVTTYSRREVITTGPDGKPRHEVVEEFEGDDSLRPMLTLPPAADMDLAFSFPMPPMPPDASMDFGMADIPAVAFPNMPMSFGFSYVDSLGHPQEWAAFSEAFQKRFQEQFGDFYKSHQQELEKMMQDVQGQMQSQFGRDFDARLEQLAQQQAELARRHADAFAQDQQQHEAHARRMEEHARRMEKEFGMHQAQFEKQTRDLEAKMQRFEKEIADQLIQDGYLKKGEQVKQLHFDEKGQFSVNGKMVKPKDAEKYRKLHEQYLGGPGGSWQYSNE